MTLRTRSLAMVWALPATGVAAVLPGTATGDPGTACAQSAAGTQAAVVVLGRKCGGRMEVRAAHAGRSQVFANVSGRITLMSGVEPAPVHRGDGTSARIDTRHRPAANGGWTPTATMAQVTMAQVRFSGGGDGPLIRVDRAGRTFALTWPMAVPQPVVRGDTAVYQEVVAGVDLQPAARPRGLCNIVMIKSAAVVSPLLKSLRQKITGYAVLAELTDGGMETKAGRLRLLPVCCKRRVTEALWCLFNADGLATGTTSERGQGQARRNLGVRLRYHRVQLDSGVLQHLLQPDSAVRLVAGSVLVGVFRCPFTIGSPSPGASTLGIDGRQRRKYFHPSIPSWDLGLVDYGG